MSLRTSINQIRLGKFAGIFVILLFLSVMLCIYFVKFIPEQKSIFHRSAFLELNQMEVALTERNEAFRQAILNYSVYKGEPKKFTAGNDYINSTPLRGRFKIKDSSGNFKFWNTSGKRLMATCFTQNPQTNAWEINFPLVSPLDSVILSRNLDTLLAPIVCTYKDIFDSYLLMRDNRYALVSEKEEKKESPDREMPNGEIIFRSGNLAVDYQVEADSLLRKTDGISIRNVTDVDIEGNQYKAFLYPFQIGSQHVILTGLISVNRYKSAYQQIPFSFISLFSVLVLLLLIHLPIIRIFMIGTYQRIRDLDIRFIIGSYFIAAFIGFFLFTKLFLDQEQDFGNRTHLNILSRQVSDGFAEEIRTISRQLTVFDRKLDSLSVNRSSLVKAMNSPEMDAAEFYQDSAQLDAILNPCIYPYGDNVFWIDGTGKWVARWAFKKIYSKSPLINVADRPYFKQFMEGQSLKIRVDCQTVQFNIQPTLSKLDGEYIISLVIPSTISRQIGGPEQSGSKSSKGKDSRPAAIPETKKPDSAILYPKLLGIGAQMHSVFRTVLPSGYYFTIVNQKGEVLYDSKPGRALLSNITKETNDPAEILQSARFHNQRYFPVFTLKGKQVALLTTPMTGFPYELLVYHDLSNNDHFQEHLIGLSAFITGLIILLLLLAALVNEWSAGAPAIFKPLGQHFDWLCPASLKWRFYNHLIRWMYIILALYLFFWIVVEYRWPESEFLLFFVTILFPFFIAIHYYLLRNEYYIQADRKRTVRSVTGFVFSHLQILLLFLILLINCYAFLEGFSWGKFFPLLLIQVLFVGAIFLSIYEFRRYPSSPVMKDSAADYKKLLRRYCLAVVTGIVLISIIPSSGIFWLVFKQEYSLELNSEMLNMAKAVQERSLDLNSRIQQYKFADGHSLNPERLRLLKYSYGIYSLYEQAEETGPANQANRYNGVSAEYAILHRLFFPQDSVTLAWTEPPNMAGDHTWYFSHGGRYSENSHLVYDNREDWINGDMIRFSGDSTSSWTAFRLMTEKMKDTGPLNIVLYLIALAASILLALRLTFSLSRRIFHFDLYNSKKWPKSRNNYADNLLQQVLDQRVKNLLSYQFSKARMVTLQKPIALRDLPADRYLLCLRDINGYEHDFSNSVSERRILWTIQWLEPVYKQIWAGLSPKEKFILYDFAVDGFANYKADKIIRNLLDKGILFFNDRRLSMITASFREYTLEQKDDKQIVDLMRKAAANDSVAHFKIPLLLLISGIGMFVFITQDAVYQKITGLFASLSSLLPLLSSLFNKPNGNK
jgi:hypothetical protein